MSSTNSMNAVAAPSGATTGNILNRMTPSLPSSLVFGSSHSAGRPVASALTAGQCAADLAAFLELGVTFLSGQLRLCLTETPRHFRVDGYDRAIGIDQRDPRIDVVHKRSVDILAAARALSRCAAMPPRPVCGR